jgi:Flp pilus assembly protein TadD
LPAPFISGLLTLSTDANVYNLKASVLLQLAEKTKDESYYHEALIALDSANKASPNNPQYLMERALFHAKRGNKELAQADLDLTRSLPKADNAVINMHIQDTIRQVLDMLPGDSPQTSII